MQFDSAFRHRFLFALVAQFGGASVSYSEGGRFETYLGHPIMKALGVYLRARECGAVCQTALAFDAE